MSDLQSTVEQWAALNPQQLCIIEAETGCALSYAQYLSAFYAMRRHIGARPRHIALALPGGIISATVWISVLTGGHTLIPLSPDATAQEKARIGQLYQPDILIVEQAAEARDFNCPGATVITRQQCEQLIQQASYSLDDNHERMTSGAGSVILHTSGSTGKPKGVLLQVSQIAWTAEHISANHRLSPQDRGLTVLPFFHVNAPVVSLCASLMTGSTVVIAQRFSRRHFWQWIEDYQITWASIVPTILAIMLETEKPAFLPGSLRFVRTASAPLPASQMEAFEAKFGLPVIETYGLSEAASQVTANPVQPAIHKAGSVGLPVGLSLRICQPLSEKGDEAWMDVEPGAAGEICISGPSVIEGYLDNADERSFRDRWFRTGDIGYLDSDGYLFITGRLREVINRGGENIAPREIEEVLLTHPLVSDAAVVGRPDPIYGEVVVAYIVTQSKGGPEMQQRLHRYAAERLSSAKVPVDYVIVSALPRTTSGKVARQVLREQELHHG
ncbi:MAG TPA: AMP-binding protein [Ktedonobacteraceae bacterium]|nr:AMP-binding protein [Ktedonobacteraceae bacterium]